MSVRGGIESGGGIENPNGADRSTAETVPEAAAGLITVSPEGFRIGTINLPDPESRGWPEPGKIQASGLFQGMHSNSKSFPARIQPFSC
jgi:hypothetical protein